jgi:transposase InsO family protein
VHSERKQRYKKIRADRVNQQWQTDLIDVSDLSHENKGNKWIMTVIDVYSRKAYAEMIYRKKPEYTAESIKKVIDMWGKAEQIQSDDGNEYEANFRKLLIEKKINQKKVKGDGHHSQGVIERFNRTLIGFIKRYMTRMRTKTIIDAIPEFIKQYNETIHSTLGASPNDVFEGKIEPLNLFLTLKESINDVNTSFNIGDVVRVRKERNIFTKGRAEKYSTTKYKILSRKGNRYTLTNGSEYSYNQLLLVGGDEDYEPPVMEAETRKKEKTEKPEVEIRRSTRERKKVEKLDL